METMHPEARTEELERGLRPTETLALAKEAIHDNLGRHWREGLDHEARVQALAYDTDAHSEGVAAVLDGRDPEFE